MIQTVAKSDCTGCQMCADICPANAIDYVERQGFYYARVNDGRCIRCGACVQKCPVIHSRKMAIKSGDPKVFAAWSTNADERRFSTSGGVYFEFAKKVIESGGYIAGVQYTPDYKAAEFAIYNNFDGLQKIRNSKYFQANAQGIYQKVKEILDRGESVLFCGTPCQNEALINFLDRSYEKLIQVDFICLAINSQKAHRKYVEYLEHRYDSSIKYLHFKHKKYGWNRFGVYAEFQNGKIYYKDRYTDLFVRGYVENHLFIRESCENCHFRNEMHKADITIGDFWGVKQDHRNPESDDGTSVLICNTKKGVQFVESLGDAIAKYKQTLEDVRMGNRALNYNPRRCENAEAFLNELDEKDYDVLIRKFAKKRTLKERISIQKIYFIYFFRKISKFIMKVTGIGFYTAGRKNLQ